MNKFELDLINSGYHATDLYAVQNRPKNTYGKACMYSKDDTYFLKSYDTIVCKLTKDGELIKYWNDYTRMTMDHVRDFLKFHGLKPMCKREWLFYPKGVFGISNLWWAEIDTTVQDGEISWKKDRSEYAKIRLSGDLGDIRICKIQTDKDDRIFVRAFGSNWYFDEFMKIGVSHE